MFKEGLTQNFSQVT